MNTCERFCAACISRRWLAFTAPRHLMPERNPSASCVPAISSCTNLSYGLFVSSASNSQPVICLRPPSMKPGPKYALRKWSFQNVIQWSAYARLSASNRSTSFTRLSGAWSRTNFFNSPAGGSNPTRSSQTRRANVRSSTSNETSTLFAAKYGVNNRSIGFPCPGFNFTARGSSGARRHSAKL